MKISNGNRTPDTHNGKTVRIYFNFKYYTKTQLFTYQWDLFRSNRRVRDISEASYRFGRADLMEAGEKRPSEAVPERRE